MRSYMCGLTVATSLAFFLLAGNHFLSPPVPLYPSLFGRSGQVLFANHAVASAVSWVQHVASGWAWRGPGSCAAVGASSHTEVLWNFVAPLCWSSLPFPLLSLAPLIGSAARRAAFSSASELPELEDSSSSPLGIVAHYSL